MVNANGQPTRARVRQGDSAFCRIDGSHRFLMLRHAAERFEHEQTLNRVRSQVGLLSPATKRMLSAVYRALFVSYSESGYQFKPFVNRQGIADKLGRKVLVPYDITMLRTLAKRGLLQESRRSLPRRQYGDIWLGAGAEFVYTIPADVLFCLLELDTREKDRLAALRPLPAADHLPARTAPKLTNKQIEQQLLTTRYKPSLWDRLLDWIGW